MPRLSDSMEEGTILRWIKAVGDEVALGDELVEIETDKANMVFEADVAGTLTEVVAQEGDTLPIGEVIARVGDAGEVAADGGAAEASPPRLQIQGFGGRRGRFRWAVAGCGLRLRRAPSAAAPRRGSSLPRCPALAGGGGACRRRRRPARQGLAAGEADRQGSRARSRRAERVRARGADHQGRRRAGGGIGTGARRCARRSSGARRGRRPRGRRPARGRSPRPRRGRPRSSSSPSSSRPSRGAWPSRRRRRPTSISTPRSTCRPRSAARTAIKAAAKEGDVVPSFNDMVVKACALALREFPRANGAYRDGRFELYSRVNVGVAVAGAGRARRADGLRRRPQGAAARSPRRLGPWPPGSATDRSPRRSSRAARSPSRTSACSASRASRR